MTNEAMIEIVKFDGEHADATLAKQLFLYDRKNKDKFWLVCAAVDTEVDLKALNKYLKVPSGKLTWGSEEALQEYLGCKKGNVNYFSIVNDKNNEVKVLFDKNLHQAKWASFHPMDNAASTCINTDGIEKIRKIAGKDNDEVFEIVDFAEIAKLRAPQK